LTLIVLLVFSTRCPPFIADAGAPFSMKDILDIEGTDTVPIGPLLPWSQVYHLHMLNILNIIETS